MAQGVRSSLVLFLAALLSNAAAFANPIPFSLKRGIPEIEVLINDSVKAVFAIDTGSDHVYIDKTFAKKHGLLEGQTQPMRPTRGIEGQTEARTFRISSLKISEIEEQNFPAVAIKLATLVKDTSKGLPDGVLGHSFLRKFTLELEYGNETTCQFHKGDYTLPDSYLFESVPFELVRHLIVVDAVLDRKKKARLMFDTGSSYCVLSLELSHSLGLEQKSSKILIKTVAVGDSVYQENVIALEREIASLLPASSDFEIGGILGTTFLRNKHLFIDYKNKMLQFVIAQNR